MRLGIVISWPMTSHCKISGAGLSVSKPVYVDEASPNVRSDARANSSGMTMVVNGLDMNYLGINSVWNNDSGLSTCHLSD